jgi:hypothetical protein
MKSITIDPTCGRENDLISFLYGEPGESEAPDFEKHLQHCKACKSEIASFGQLRGSIGAWKQEALNGFAPAQRPPQFEASRKRSALAALREFFDLSPLWLKGGVAFATVLFCFFAVLVLGRLRTLPAPPLTAGKGDAIYSKQDVERMLKAALEHQTVLSEPGSRQAQALVEQPKIPRNPGKRVRGGPMQLAGNRRPLSRSEREQLAADLRLITPGDEEDFDLLGDRINR